MENDPSLLTQIEINIEKLANKNYLIPRKWNVLGNVSEFKSYPEVFKDSLNQKYFEGNALWLALMPIGRLSDDVLKIFYYYYFIFMEFINIYIQRLKRFKTSCLTKSNRNVM